MQSILSPRLGIYHLHFLLYFKVSHKADRFKEYEISPTPQRKELKSYLKEHDSQKGGELESFCDEYTIFIHVRVDFCLLPIQIILKIRYYIILFSSINREVYNEYFLALTFQPPSSLFLLLVLAFWCFFPTSHYQCFF